jgi:orotidine-5'-phosphate decarboxylase
MDSRVIVALDFPDAEAALRCVGGLPAGRCRLKVGKELFTAAGPRLVTELHERGFEVFLDLKFHDIPNTVAQACKAAAKLGVWMINVHALGGRKMLGAAREALEGSGSPRPYLIAVTILTSLAAEDLQEVGIAGTPQSVASRLAALSQSCGLDGVVCSAQEAAMLRESATAGFLLVTPGIRTLADAVDDQKRVVTPGEAIGRGASYLVIGRPITRAADPAMALHAINTEVAAALAARNMREQG